jgi:hypothetical protein
VSTNVAASAAWTGTGTLTVMPSSRRGKAKARAGQMTVAQATAGQWSGLLRRSPLPPGWAAAIASLQAAQQPPSAADPSIKLLPSKKTAAARHAGEYGYLVPSPCAATILSRGLRGPLGSLKALPW